MSPYIFYALNLERFQL